MVPSEKWAGEQFRVAPELSYDVDVLMPQGSNDCAASGTCDGVGGATGGVAAGWAFRTWSASSPPSASSWPVSRMDSASTVDVVRRRSRTRCDLAIDVPPLQLREHQLAEIAQRVPTVGS